jgi:hypothetical protein
VLKKAIFLILAASTAFAMGQKTILVHLPPSGQYVLFTSHGRPTQAPTAPTAAKGGDASIVSSPTDDEISVWNKVTGNIGSRPISKVEGGWTIADSDLDNVAVVGIKVQHNGNPVAAAQVQLMDGVQRDPVIIDPTSAGIASFFDVKPGRLISTVRVKDSSPITQIFLLALARSEPEPTFTVAVAQAVDVPAAAPGSANPSGGVSTASSAPKPPQSSAANPIGKVITYVVALALAAGLGYGILVYAKKNPDLVAERLEKLGVQIPKPDHLGTTGGAPVAFDPQPKPAPPQKILLDDAAPTPLAGPVSSPFVPSPITNEPALIASSGVEIPLVTGETVVGRDAGLGLSLSGESSISRRHATLTRSGNEVIVADLGSTNGTFLNGAKIQSPTSLRSGDTIQFGSVAFRYQG